MSDDGWMLRYVVEPLRGRILGLLSAVVGLPGLPGVLLVLLYRIQPPRNGRSGSLVLVASVNEALSQFIYQSINVAHALLFSNCWAVKILSCNVAGGPAKIDPSCSASCLDGGG